MREMVNQLKNTDVISKENINKLKKYIVKKYPGYNYKEQTKVFADSVHKILNRSLMPFEENKREKIKLNILKDAVNKREFSINAYDVFRECIIENDGDSVYYQSIEVWLNNQENLNVDPSRLKIFLDNIYQKSKDNIDETINNAAEVTDSIEAYDSNKVTDNTEKIEKQGVEANGSIKESEAAAASSEIINNQRLILQNPIHNEDISFMQILYSLCSHLALKFVNSIKKALRLLILDRKYRKAAAACLLSITILIFLAASGINFVLNNSWKSIPADNEIISNGDMGIVDGLSSEFKYTQIDTAGLKSWLNNKNSILSDDKYLMPIIDASKEFNVNPILLIAITGQEQAFVPKNEKNAEKIANNPFNVFGSWQSYNTNIKDSARIAAETVVDSSNGRPVNEDEIQWINRKYSQDPKWWVGVTKIFYQIKKDINNK